MLFNSFIFIVFAIVFFLIWPLANRNNNLRWIYLTVASFLFYGWWDWRFLFLLIASGLLDFIAALYIQKYHRWKFLLLLISISGNIGSLLIFKYSGFIAGNIDKIISFLGFNFCLTPQIPHFFLLLPVGISFYTFQSMSYTIDVYYGKIKATKNPFHFFAYLSLFPQLVAGPIVRASDLLPQLEKPGKPDSNMRWEGMQLIVHGYFKKVVIADNLADFVTAAFGAASINPSSLYWWLVISMFAFQIYCDFSGYSDIARGLANWMGYSFQLNFNHPYGATSIREFWRRWHISLSTWFRDYVYLPLGGSKKGRLRAHFNMWITMVLSGIWHGAAWNFVIWGALNALYLSIERLTGWPEYLEKFRFGKYVSTTMVIVQVWIAWVFFRAESLEKAIEILFRMFRFSSFSPGLPEAAMLFLALAVLTEIVHCYKGLLMKPYFRSYRLLQPVAYAILIVICVYLRGPGNEFIYFRF